MTLAVERSRYPDEEYDVIRVGTLRPEVSATVHMPIHQRNWTLKLTDHPAYAEATSGEIHHGPVRFSDDLAKTRKQTNECITMTPLDR